MRKCVLRNFTKFTGKHLCQSLFFKKVVGLRRLRYRCFPVNFAKFLRTSFLQNTSGRVPLLGEIIKFSSQVFIYENFDLIIELSIDFPNCSDSWHATHLCQISLGEKTKPFQPWLAKSSVKYAAVISFKFSWVKLLGNVKPEITCNVFFSTYRFKRINLVILSIIFALPAIVLEAITNVFQRIQKSSLILKLK